MPQATRVCLVGVGRAGQVHANSLVNHLTGGHLVALVDQSRDALRTASERYGIEDCYVSLEQALEHDSFDAVVITTPTFTHKSLTVLAANHGKHVFCEKPMALNLVE